MQYYFDNAATTPMLPEVIDLMTQSMRDNFGNPSSTHAAGRAARAEIEKARKKIAELLKVQASEIVFTSSGTEANNLILRSCVRVHNVELIISSNIEHKCVSETILDLEKQNDNLQVEYVQLDESGCFDLEHFEKLLKNNQGKKTLVSLMHANNEVGNINPIEKIVKIAHENNALVHSDMVQTIGHYDLDLEAMGIDFASSSAHKYHGPKGVGFAFIKKNISMKAILTGGGQERSMRSGTENLHGILGMRLALEKAIENLEKDKAYILDLKEYTKEELKRAIPEINFMGQCAQADSSLYTLLSICLPFPNNLIGFELDLKNIQVSQGSACSSGAVKPGGVISHLIDEKKFSECTPLRLSFSKFNTKDEIDYMVNSLAEITKKSTQKA